MNYKRWKDQQKTVEKQVFWEVYEVEKLEEYDGEYIDFVIEIKEEIYKRLVKH